MVLPARSDTANQTEILVLRHQLAILQPRTPRPRMSWAGRAKFLHAHTILTCDLFHLDTITPRRHSPFVVTEHATRRVLSVTAGVTATADGGYTHRHKIRMQARTHPRPPRRAESGQMRRTASHPGQRYGLPAR